MSIDLVKIVRGSSLLIKTCLSMSSGAFFLHWLDARYVDDEACNEATQIKAPIETTGEGSQERGRQKDFKTTH